MKCKVVAMCRGVIRIIRYVCNAGLCIARKLWVIYGYRVSLIGLSSIKCLSLIV